MPPYVLSEAERARMARKLIQVRTEDIEPEFLDFKKTIKTARLAPHLSLKAVRRPDSRLFRLYYIFEMGKVNDPLLSVAASYLPFLGTGKYTPQQMQQAFYRIGVHFSANCQNERTYLTLSGLDDSLEAGIELMEHLLADLQPNPEALENLKADVLLRRENSKKDKNSVLNKALFHYGKYGRRNPYTDKLTKEEILALRAEDLTKLLRVGKGMVISQPDPNRTVDFRVEMGRDYSRCIYALPPEFQDTPAPGTPPPSK